MNKATFSTTLTVLLGLLIFLPLFAAAAPSITETSVELTVDYSKFVDEDDDVIVVTTESFTVDNTDGSGTVTIKAVGLPSKYKSQSTPVGAGKKEQVSLTIEVPHDKSPGKEKIGAIIITDSNNSPLGDRADLIQDTKFMLDLTELEVKYVESNGKTEKDEFNTDDNTYKLENEVRPFTEMSFTFDLHNLFDRDYQDKGILEEIELTIDTSDEFFVEGFEDTYQIENIEAGKERKHTVTLPINEEVEPDAYTIELTITAEDSEGIEYEIKKEVELEIELDDDDIRIVKAKLAPETATICDKEASLLVEVHNFGSDDQDKVKVTVSNTELGLNEKVEDIAIDAYTEDDDSWQKNFLIPLEKSKTKVYYLDVKTYLENTLTDAEVVQLELKPCTVEEPAVDEQEEEPTLAESETQPSDKQTTEKEEVTGNIIKSVEKTLYTSNDYLVALMLIAIAVSAATVVLMLVVLFKA